MKKIMSLVLVLALCLSLFAGCGAASDDATDDVVKIAFITDVGTVNDKSFNQSTWEGVVAWCAENGAECKYYQPVTSDHTDLVDAIYQAIDDGYTTICSAGYIFPSALVEVALVETDINFVHLDGGFDDGSLGGLGLTAVPSNIASFSFTVEDAGWLAGYACVMDGYTELAYVGGMALPSVYNAGQGFVQGADAAAAELGITIDMQYGFTGNFDDTPENKTLFKAVLANGSDVIFSFGGNNTNSAILAVTESSSDAWIVYPDIDGSYQSDLVITSVMKQLGPAIALGLDDLFKNNGAKYFGAETPGGVVEDMVGIPIETSRFESFDTAAYEEAIAISKTIDVIVSDEAEATGITTAQFASLLGLTNTTISFIS